MFYRKDCIWFSIGATICITGLASFALDPADNGLGLLSLWVAPPLFLAGLVCLIPGIVDKELWTQLKPKPIKSAPFKYAGLALSFCLSLSLYGYTLEPTASLWDCSEFIASAYKLQTPHTPGNPLLLLFGRMFSMLALNDPQKVAWSINLMSAHFASLTLALVYLTIHRIIGRIGTKPTVATIASLCGSLILAFSDTFWFSAVEAETYASSSFYMMLILWLILVGLELQDVTRARLLVLIFYVAGLSFCVHPMSLLALPLLPIAWYLKDRQVTIKNAVIALTIGISIVLFINRFVAVGVFEIAFYLDLFLVNSMGLPFFSGAVIALIMLIAMYFIALKKFPALQRYIYASMFLLVGFLPYTVLFIRSSYNLAIDEGNPQNLALIKAYMNREGYPTRPLLFGPYFDAEITRVTPVKKIFYEGDSQYEFAGTLSEYEYTRGRQTILPRIYSNDADHIQTYGAWLNLEENEKPSFLHNIEFMFRYQLGHMYWRYILFNFAGRKSDVQNSPWLRPWEPVCASAETIGSKARNQYFMIPLLCGVAGAIFLFLKSRKDFILLFTFFALTGFALALYLNSTPNEPRERDYIYVGSYIAFTIFIAVGIAAGLNSISNNLIRRFFCLIAMALPCWMFLQNFDDHNRRGRTLQIDNARNVLASCEPNAILFTGGDNDTFPLWYLQEVEGFRTDVRVVVLSYLNTDWYINQLRVPVNASPSFALSLDEKAYRQYGPNDIIYVQEQLQEPIDSRKFLSLLNQEHQALTVSTENGDAYSLLPSRSLLVDPVKKILTERDSAPEMIQYKIAVKGKYLAKNGLAILDLLTNNPGRPFHFNFTSIGQTGLNLDEYVTQKGQVYQITPEHHSAREIPIDTKSTLENLVNRFDLSNVLTEDVYLSYEDHEMRIIQPIRQSYNALAMQLLRQGDLEKAGLVLDKALMYLYTSKLRPSFANIQAADILMKLDRKTEAEKLATSLYNYCFDQDEIAEEINVQLLHWSAQLLEELGKPEYMARLNGATPR